MLDLFPLGRLQLDLFAVALGLIVGSYLNVVVHRLPRGISTVTPRSRCPGCGAPIRWFDNLPLVSWLRLRGRCRHCAAPIAWRYPAVEVLAGLLFLAAAERFGWSWETPVGWLFLALLLALAAIDVEHLLLPDRLTLPGIVAGLAVQPLLPWGGWVVALAGAMLGGGLLLALWGGWYLLRGEEGMGLGDVKMLAMIGAFLGWKGVAVALFAATFFGSVVGLGLVVAGRGGMKSRLPFGLFLSLGGAVALFWGHWLVDAYLGLL
ncbi:MAG TPA: prepilin peptidase [Thermoanaerobaculia bacterium]|nr:prepilin peptidase [Thermoanaerobaculia bacterium]